MSGPVLRRRAHPAPDIDKPSMAPEDPPEDVENPGPRRSFAPGGRDPVALAPAIFREVVAWLTDDDEGDDESDDEGDDATILGILKDIAVGIVLGILCIVVMVFLDHRDIIHLQSAHDMRETGNQLLSDPARLASIEEAAGIKFLKPEEHAEMEKELEHYAQQKVEIAAKAKEKEAAEAKIKELTDAKVPEEYERLASNPLLELGRYCDVCPWKDSNPWKDGKACKERAEEAAKADGAGRVASKLKIMATDAALWEEKAPVATCSFPPGCRWDCYAENYADLKKGFGGSEQVALEHWIAHGFKAGRSCKCKGG